MKTALDDILEWLDNASPDEIVEAYPTKTIYKSKDTNEGNAEDNTDWIRESGFEIYRHKGNNDVKNSDDKY